MLSIISLATVVYILVVVANKKYETILRKLKRYELNERLKSIALANHLGKEQPSEVANKS